MLNAVSPLFHYSKQIFYPPQLNKLSLNTSGIHSSERVSEMINVPSVV